MSTDTLVEQHGPGYWRQRAIFRFGTGVATAMILAASFEWSLSMITPIFVAMLLGPPGVRLPHGAYSKLLLAVAFTFAVGIGLVALLPYALMFVPLQTLLLFLTFYRAERGMNPLIVVMLLIAILMFPSLGLMGRNLAIGFALGFLGSLAIALALCALFYAWIPSGPAPKPTPPVLPSEAEAYRNAWLSTLLVLPLLLFFYLTDRSGDLLVLILVAILSQSPGLAAGSKAGLGMIVANLVGGAAAMLFYNLLVAVPTWIFFVLLMWLTALLFGQAIFTSPKGKVFATGFTTLLILIGSTTFSGGGEASTKLILRIGQMLMATGYLALGAWVMGALGWIPRSSD
ncbi:DUF2955 domain-containing protein [Ferrimonas balearica]|uniref:DUF2955 domain-containing protein n=1 Tax=Ferrimonas balearica TaxID=44012 RepID=UPI001C9A009F|nr:DUF2955 domain-containing protein [Ferrimonas balearica]MBY5921879.1 DUF2955 domain-containing protein [Ferrimonas balearica]MBY5994781.1 DUF2955 domain-containing protein [Ferrimonas balearica]